MVPVSVCIICKNEEEVLAQCLESVSWADEVVIIDSGSTDASLTIAKKYKAKVYNNPWAGFGPQRQFAEKMASHNWIFAIDCDEVVPEGLKQEIIKIFKSTTPPEAHNVYYVNRLTHLFGRFLRYGEMHPDRIARLYNKTHTGYNDLLVHEKVKVEGCIKIKLKTKLLHFYKSTYEDYNLKLNRYAEDSAQEKFLAQQSSNYFEAYSRAIFAFIKNYIFKFGFLDFRPGFLIALSRFKYTYLKYDLLIKKNRQRQQSKKL